MVGGDNIWRPKWKAALVEASSADETDVGINVEVKSQVPVHDASSSGGLTSQDESSNRKMASSTGKHSITLEKGYLCCGNKMVGGDNIWRPKWKAALVEASSADETDVGINVEVKSQVPVHDASSSGGLTSQDESSNRKMASSTGKHSITLEKGYLCCGNKMVGGDNIWRPKWKAALVEASSADETDVGINVEVKSQVPVHDASSSGGLTSQDESSNRKMASSTGKHSITLEKGYLCCGNKMVGGDNIWRPKWKAALVEASSADETDVGINVEVKSQVPVHDASSSGGLTSQDESSNRKMASSTGKHSITLEVGSSLMRFIKGKWGSTQAKIEQETGVRLIFPSSRSEDSLIIEGTPDSVGKASERIQLLIEEVVKTPALDYSHFISLPLALHPPLIDKLINFKDSILGINDANTSTLSELGIDKSIFINPKTFHLTVLMLKLWNKERVNAAVKILKEVEAEVMDALDGRPVSIKLNGLELMKGSVEKARVLYAPVEVIGGAERLLHACKIITDAFIKGGLVLERDANHTLKLHATVMNTRQRKRRYDTKKFNSFNDSFDARGIMAQYGSEEWGEYAIPELHLSQMFVYDENGYYHCCASFPLPENIQAG